MAKAHARAGRDVIKVLLLRDLLPGDRLGSFQLEKVYVTKVLKDGRRVRRGPYGPYWYSYHRTAGGHYVSTYIGKPDAFDPSELTAKQLARYFK